MKNRESSTERWLRTGLVVFLAVLLLAIIFTGTGKGSDVSNWVIAGANIAMAAAAVKAWRAAQKFLGEFFAQEGYRLAIALINENIIHLGIDNEFTTLANNAIAVCTKLDGDRYTRVNHTLYTTAVKQLETLQTRHVAILENMRSLSFRMETYGIHAAEVKKEPLIAMVLALDEMNRLGAELLGHIRNDTGAYDLVLCGGIYKEQFNSNYLPLMKTLMVSINCQWNLMVDNRAQLLSGGKHARTLFVVREN